MKTVIIMGSTSDEPHAKKITDKLDEYGITWEQHAASAHKQPLKVLEILETNKNQKDIIYKENFPIFISTHFIFGIYQNHTIFSCFSSKTKRRYA